MRIRFTRAATKHGIAHQHSRDVVEHCGLIFIGPAPPHSPSSFVERLLYLGDDATGRPLEVMAIETGPDDLLIIYAMPLRRKYLLLYQEAKRWVR